RPSQVFTCEGVTACDRQHDTKWTAPPVPTELPPVYRPQKHRSTAEKNAGWALPPSPNRLENFAQIIALSGGLVVIESPATPPGAHKFRTAGLKMQRPLNGIILRVGRRTALHLLLVFVVALVGVWRFTSLISSSPHAAPVAGNRPDRGILDKILLD